MARLTPARFVALYELAVKPGPLAYDKRTATWLLDAGLVEWCDTTDYYHVYRATSAALPVLRDHLEFLEKREAKGRMFRSDSEQDFQIRAAHYRAKLDDAANEDRPETPADRIAEVDEVQDEREAAPVARRVPSDWWTISDRSGAELVRVHGEFMADASASAREYPEVRDASRRDGGFQLRRLYEDELTEAEAAPFGSTEFADAIIRAALDAPAPLPTRAKGRPSRIAAAGARYRNPVGVLVDGYGEWEWTLNEATRYPLTASVRVVPFSEDLHFPGDHGDRFTVYTDTPARFDWSAGLTEAFALDAVKRFAATYDGRDRWVRSK